MSRTFSADSPAPPEAAWSLLAEPGRWAEWAPHLRGAWHLGEPEVQDGRTGAARLLWAVPVPARIVGKRPGRSWTWRVGPVVMDHAVTARPGGGSRVSLTIQAPAPLEGLVAATYGPVVQVLLERLARRAAAS